MTSAVLAGMAGAALPDIDKPCKIVFGRSPWPGFVDRFHAGIQRESLDRQPVEAAAATIFGGAALTTLLRHRG